MAEALSEPLIVPGQAEHPHATRVLDLEPPAYVPPSPPEPAHASTTPTETRPRATRAKSVKIVIDGDHIVQPSDIPGASESPDTAAAAAAAAGPSSIDTQQTTQQESTSQSPSSPALRRILELRRKVASRVSSKLYLDGVNLIFWHLLAAAAFFARQSFCALVLLVAILYPVRYDLKNGTMSPQLPRRVVLGAAALWSLLYVIVGGILYLLFTFDAGSLQMRNDNELLFDTLGIFDPTDETSRTLIAFSLQLSVFLTAAHLFQKTRSLPFASGARTKLRNFTTAKVLRLAFFAGCSAVIVQSYAFIPFLLLFWVLLFTFIIPRRRAMKWRIVCMAAQAHTLIGSVILCAVLIWQNRGLRDDDVPVIGLYHQVSWTKGDLSFGYVIFVQRWLLLLSIVTSRAIHRDWAQVRPVEVDHYTNRRSIERSSAPGTAAAPASSFRRNMLAKFLKWVFYFLPLLLLPILVVVVVAVQNVISLMLTCIVFWGGLIPIDVFVASLPYFYVLCALMMTCLYAAVLNRGSPYAEAFFVAHYTERENASAIGIQVAAISVFILACVLFKRNPSKKTYKTRKDKQRRLVSALRKLRGEIPQLKLFFLRHCDAVTCMVHRDKLGALLEDVTHAAWNHSDVEATWNFFTAPVSLRTASASSVATDRSDLMSPLQSPSAAYELDAPLLARGASFHYDRSEGEFVTPRADDEGGEEGDGGGDAMMSRAVGDATEMRTISVPPSPPPPTGNDGGNASSSRFNRSPQASPAPSSTSTSTAGRLIHNESDESDDYSSGEEDATMGNSSFTARSHDDLNDALRVELLTRHGGGGETEASEGPVHPSATTSDVIAASIERSGDSGAAALSKERGLKYSDFIVLMHFVRNHETKRSTLLSFVDLSVTLVKRNASSLSLVAMFAAATYDNRMDILRMAYVLLFVVFLCAPPSFKRFWPVIVIYNMLYILAQYSYSLYSSTAEFAGPDESQKEPLVGLYARMPINLGVYFILLAFGIAEMRLFSSSREFRNILEELDWRVVARNPVVIRFHCNVVIVMTVLCFLLVALIEPRSLLVAGFLSLFLLVIIASAHSLRVANVFWVLTTVYSVAALVLVSLYQFEDIRRPINQFVSSWSTKCRGDAVVDCASQLGLRKADSLTLTLLPWFLACASNVVQLRLRQVHSTVIEAFALIFNRNDLASAQQIIKASSLRLGLRILYRVTEWGFVVDRILRDHAFKLVWAALFYATINSISVIGWLYMLLFIFDRRGGMSLVISVGSMAILYSYPFFFVPRIPHPADMDVYYGFTKRSDESYFGVMSGPFFVFCAAVIYQRSKPLKEEQIRHAQQLERDEAASISSMSEESSQMLPSSIFEHVLRFLFYIKENLFVDLGFEIVLMTIIISIIVTIERITASLLFVLLVMWWVFGRVRIISARKFTLVFQAFTYVFASVQYFIVLGLPQSYVDVSPFNGDCGHWWRYLGCRLPRGDFAPYFLVVAMTRIIRLHIGATKRRCVVVDDFVRLGDLLRARSKEVDNLRALKRIDVEVIIPAPQHDILRQPRVATEAFAALYNAVFLPAFLSFFHGALTSSVLGVAEVLLGLCLLAYKREIWWNFYRYWPLVIAIFLLYTAIQIITYIPAVRAFSSENQSVAQSLGLATWQDHVAALQVIVMFSVVLQDRLFNEFFFASELISLFRGSNIAKVRNREMMEYLEGRERQEEVAAREEEAKLMMKLERLKAERRGASASAVVVVTGDAAATDAAPGAPPPPPPPPAPGYIAAAHSCRDEDQKRHAVEPEPVLHPSHVEFVPRLTEVEMTWDFFAPTQSTVAAAAEASEAPPVRLVSPLRDEAVNVKHMEEVMADDGPFPPSAAANAAPVADDTSAAPAVGSRDSGNTDADNCKDDGRAGGEDGELTWLAKLQLKFAVLSGKYDAAVEQLIISLAKRTYDGKVPSSASKMHLRLAQVVVAVGIRHFSYFVFGAFAINFALSGTVADMILCLSAVCYGMLFRPWPTQAYWSFTFFYNVFNILLKSLLKVIVEQVELSAESVEAISILFVDVSTESSGYSASDAALLDIIFDFVVFGSILIHLHLCTDYGVYTEMEEMSSLPPSPQPAPPDAEWRREEDLEPASPALCDRVPVDGDQSNNAAATPRDGVKRVGAEPAADATEPVSEGDSHEPSSPIEEDDEERLVVKIFDGIRSSTVSVWSKARSNVSQFVTNAESTSGTGVDYYLISAIVDGVALVYFVITYYSLTGRASGSFIQSVRNDLLPGPLVLLLILGILIMVTDRVLYVVSWMRGKLFFHCAVCFGYHAVFVMWKVRMATPTVMPLGVIFLLIKMGYIWIACAQIRHGYKAHRAHDPFTSSPSTLNWLGYTIYRTIPFLWELRLLVDWTFSRTALKLQAWMLLEDIHNEVYLRYIDIADWAWTNPTRGRSFPKIVRAYQGAVGFILIMVVLFAPLLYNSTFNPSLRPNRITTVAVSMNLNSLTDFYGASTTGPPLSPDIGDWISRTRPTLRRLEFSGNSRGVQFIPLGGCSSSYWTITPESRTMLLHNLDTVVNNASTFKVLLTVALTRSGASGDSSLETVLRRESQISWAAAVQLRNLISGNSTAPVVLRSFMTPFIFNLPNSVSFFSDIIESTGPAASMVDCAVTLRRTFDVSSQSFISYWCVSCDSLFTSGNTPSSNKTAFPEWGCLTGSESCAGFDFEQRPPTHQTPPYLVATSDRVPLDSNFLPNTGIIAIYTTLILTLASVLRGSVTGNAHRIVMKQIADPQPVAELLSYIYLSRSVGDGSIEDLALEEQIFFELIDLLRAPDRIVTLTGRRVDDFSASGSFQNRFTSLNPF